MSSPRIPSGRSLDEALKAHVQEAPLPTNHPHIEKIEAFLLGEIDKDEVELIESHIAMCSECAEQVLELKDFLGDISETPTKAELSKAWGRHQEIKSRKTRGASVWAGWPLLAAALLLTSIGLGLWNLSLVRQIDSPSPLRRVVLASDESRGKPFSLAIEQDADLVVQLQPKTFEGNEFSSYRVRLFDASGRLRYEVRGQRDQDPDIFLRIPRGALPEGTFNIVLWAVGKEEEVWDEFEIKMVRN